ncbi:MAG: hypothetical protein WAM85_01090, partial [Terracidiphilus sp.]
NGITRIPSLLSASYWPALCSNSSANARSAASTVYDTVVLERVFFMAVGTAKSQSEANSMTIPADPVRSRSDH